MQLKIIAMNQISFDGEVQEVTITTEVGEITILPGHQTITSIVVPGIVSITPSQVPETGYLIEQGIIKISVGKGLLQMIGDDITILTSISITSASQSAEVLSQMKKDMEEQLAKIKQEGNTEDLEKALIEMEKIGAELRMAKIGKVSN